MAKGGARPNSGRKKGITSRPRLIDYYNPKELKEFISSLKEQAKTDPVLKKFVAEQLFGKAVQPIGNDGDEPFKIAGVDIVIRK